MKKLILFINFLVGPACANAQSPIFQWAKSMGANSDDQGLSIAADASENVYVTGYFSGTIDFDPGPGTFNLTANGLNDVFISKTDANGNFVWAKNIGGNLDDYGFCITVDAFASVYTIGKFQNTADFDPDVSGTFNLTSGGDQDVFISKLDASGNFVWAKKIGGGSPDAGTAIKTDASGNVYATGTFSNIVDFDPGPGIFNLSAAPNNDMFILKLDGSGNFVWAKHAGGSATIIYGNSLVLDASGNIYIGGYFSGTADFDPGAAMFNLISNGSNNDIFISKFDASANLVWAKNMGSTSNDLGFSIAIDPTGSVYSTGIFWGTVDFDPNGGIFNLTSSPNNFDIFISKLDASGNFVWTKQMGGLNSDFSYALALDASYNVYTTGAFTGTADFDPNAGTFNLTATGSGDVFISKLDSSGNFVWAKNIGGSMNADGLSIVTVPSGNVYTTGYFRGTVDFDPGVGTYNLTSSSFDDIFIHKMSQCSPPSATITPGGTTAFCSGGSVTLSANNGLGFNYQWKKNGTDISGATNQNYTATAAGSYSVVVTNACGTAASSSVSVTVNSLPSVTITPAGPTTFCSGSSVVLNAVVAANRSYQWKKSANLISGATLSSYTATTSANYRVIVTNTVTGCSKTTGNATVVTVNPKPAAAITPQGSTTFCAGGSIVLAANTGTGLTYKWKKNNVNISGASLINYTATTAGVYRVEVTNSNGCSKTSAGVTVTVPCKLSESESESEFDVKVFPNPNSGEFTIEFSNKPSSPLFIELTDELGKVVKKFETNDETIVIKESNLPKGIYCLTARNKDEVMIKKISVVK